MAVAIASAIGMLILILDSQTALSGATEGIALCLQTVIPSLFPFFLLSDLLTGAMQNRKIGGISVVNKLWKIPQGSENLLLTGLLGGYPIGASCVSQAYVRGSISRSDAERMCIFCNACGPAFLFGIGSGILGGVLECLLAWLALLLSGWITAVIVPWQPTSLRYSHAKRTLSLTESLQRSIKGMASVCAWVVLFRVALNFLERWLLSLFPNVFRIAVLGFFELTNGCIALKEISHFGLRFILFVAMISFGGLCGTMQTVSTLSQQISRRAYFPGKLFQCCVSIILAWIVQLFFPNASQSLLIPFVSALIALPLGFFLRKTVKNSSISAEAIV